jgi:hypothetical protein
MLKSWLMNIISPGENDNIINDLVGKEDIIVLSKDTWINEWELSCLFKWLGENLDDRDRIKEALIKRKEKVKNVLPVDKDYSIVTYLDTVWLPFEKPDRVELAKALWINDYKFSAVQNLYMLALIKWLDRELINDMMQQWQYYKWRERNLRDLINK